MPEKNILKRIFVFFDKLEDRVRTFLSHRPILYTCVGGIGVVLFWRGIWHTADMFPFLTGPMSLAISVIILLLSGLFVSYFVGDMIIISGLKKEKKIFERTEEEVKDEGQEMELIDMRLSSIEKNLDHIARIIDKKDDKNV